MTTMFSTPKLCNYPECKAIAKKTWALLPLCYGHHDTIRLETLKYYANRMPYDSRQHYLQIARLIKRVTPFYAQRVKKSDGIVKKTNEGGDEQSDS
jgi:hypothetical protein